MENYTAALGEFLSGFISETRKQKFHDILALRTRYLTVAVEDIYQPHNISAVLRSAECFGVQDVHIIGNRNKYNPNPDIVMGASKWLTLHHYTKTEDNTLSCIRSLKEKGYRIVATTPHEEQASPETFDLEKGKAVLFFGTELEGISETVKREADEFLTIPMYGFTESFNISVSAAICLYALTSRLRKSDKHWQLDETEKAELFLEWTRNTLNRPDLLEEEFRKKAGLV
ncbi:MAG TPA: RNA methyltransferase [Bacteroidia bacterium]|nr:RNA methyltransferase [Bacteroidia bacterium]